MGSSISTITLDLDINGSKALRTLSDVSNNLDSIKQKADLTMPEASDYFDMAQRSIEAGYERASRIDKELSDISLPDYKRELLLQEKGMITNSIEAMFTDLIDIQKLTTSLAKEFTGKRGKSSSSSLRAALPSLLSEVTNMHRLAKGIDYLYEDSEIVSHLKDNKTTKSILDGLKIAKNSNVESDLLKYLAIVGSPQVKRGTFVSRMSKNAEVAEHMFGSFEEMLPSAFLNFHQAAGKTSILNKSATTALTADERKLISNLVMNNAYFARAAESAGIAQRSNGRMQLLRDITRENIEEASTFLYDTLIESAKGMPMYGLTDVNDPEKWQNIARKTNKPFLGTLQAGRVLSDKLPWLSPKRHQKGSNVFSPMSRVFIDEGEIETAPIIDRYEVARYTLEDMKSRKNLNDVQRAYEDNPEDHYFAVDDSIHMRNIFSHRPTNKTVRNNEAIDDIFYLALDDRFKDPNLKPEIREQLINEYAEQLGKSHYRKHGKKNNEYIWSGKISPHLGAEFMLKEHYDAILKDDPWYFSAGLEGSDPNDPMNILFSSYKDLAGTREYMLKNSTTSQDIRKLYGSNFPSADKLKIKVVNMEESAKSGTGIGAGLNGASYISNKYIQKGFQGRIHGLKGVLNPIDFQALSKMYNGGIILPGAGDGEFVTLEGDEDLVINLSDLKNAGLKFQGMNSSQIADIIAKKYLPYGIGVSRTADQANKSRRWISGQMAQFLKNDKALSQMSTDAFMKMYQEVGTPEGALRHVFGGSSEMRDILLDSSGAGFQSRLVQERIDEFRNNMISRIGKGDLLLPEELTAQTAMGAPWIINALNRSMEKMTGAQYQGKLFEDRYARATNDIDRGYIEATAKKYGFSFNNGKFQFNRKPDQAKKFKEKYDTAKTQKEKERILARAEDVFLKRTQSGEFVEQTGLDALFSMLTDDQKQIIGMADIGDSEVLFQNSAMKSLGISRFPATSQSAQTVRNALRDQRNNKAIQAEKRRISYYTDLYNKAQNASEKADVVQKANKAGFVRDGHKFISRVQRKHDVLQSVMKDLGLDESQVYIGTDSPLMQWLQGADFDGDVFELFDIMTRDIKQNDNTPKAVVGRAFLMAQKQMQEYYKKYGFTPEKLQQRKEQMTKDLFEGKSSYNLKDPKDAMRFAALYQLNSSSMGGPNAVLRNAAQLSMTKEIVQAMADAEAQYDVNSTQGKKAKHIDTTQSQIGIMSKFKPFTEFFNMVDKSRDEFGRINYNELQTKAREDATGMWAINAPFQTMSANVRSMLTSRYYAKQKGWNINENYNWDEIFDTIYGKTDTSTALGRMQSAVRDIQKGFLNADYLFLSNDSALQAAALRQQAIDEEKKIAAKLAVQNSAEFEARYGKSNTKNFDRLITSYVDRRGGTMISNLPKYGAVESNMDKGVNSAYVSALKNLGMPGELIGRFNWADEMTSATNLNEVVEKIKKDNKGLYDVDLLTQWNKMSLSQKKQRLDRLGGSGGRLSYSTVSEAAMDPYAFLRHLLDPNFKEETHGGTEIGQSLHSAAAYFMRQRKAHQATGKDATEDDLIRWRDQAIAVFNHELGIPESEEDQKNRPSQWPESEKLHRRLNPSERKNMLGNPNHIYYKEFQAATKWLREDLTKIFPQEEYEILGVESEDNITKNNGKRMPIQNMGKKMTSDEDVGMTGAYDLLVRHKKTGRIEIGDYKLYANPKAEDFIHFDAQQKLYAKAVSDAGAAVEAYNIILPLQGLLKNFEIGDRDISENTEHFKTAISNIQKFFGSDQAISPVDMLNFKEDLYTLIYGTRNPERFSFGSKIKEKNTNESVSGTTITGALLMHDEYNNALEELDDVRKFARAETKNENARFARTDLWAYKKQQIEDARVRAQSQLEAGNEAEYAKLNSEVEDAESKLFEAFAGNPYRGIKGAAARSYDKLAQSMSDVLSSSKITQKAQGITNVLQKINEQKLAAEEDYTETLSQLDSSNARIDELNRQIKEKNELVRRSDDPAVKMGTLTKQQDVLNALLGFSTEIETNKRAGRQKRTKFLNADDNFEYIKNNLPEIYKYIDENTGTFKTTGNDEFDLSNVLTKEKKRIDAEVENESKEVLRLSAEAGKEQDKRKNLLRAKQEADDAKKAQKVIDREYNNFIQNKSKNLMSETLASLRGEKYSNNGSLREDMLARVQEIRGAQQSLKQLAENGAFGKDWLNSGYFKQMSADLQQMLSPAGLAEYRKRAASERIKNYQNNKVSWEKLKTPADIFSDINEKAKDKSDQIEQELTNINKDLMSGSFGPEERKALKALKDYYETFNLSEYTSRLFGEQEEKLGMKTKTPEEVVNAWRNERLNLRSAKERHALELLSKGKTDEYDKFNKEHPPEERDDINRTANAMLSRMVRERQNEITDYWYELSGDRMGRNERVNRRYQQTRDKIQEEFDKLGTNDPQKARYRDLLYNNDAIWNEYRARLNEEERTKDTLRRLEFDRKGLITGASLEGRKLTYDENYASILNRLEQERIARQEEIRQQIGGAAGEQAAREYGIQHNDEELRRVAANEAQSIEFRRRASEDKQLRDAQKANDIAANERLSPEERVNRRLAELRANITNQSQEITETLRNGGYQGREDEAINAILRLDSFDYDAAESRFRAEEGASEIGFLAANRIRTLKTAKTLENRSFTRDEMVTANHARLIQEREDYIESQLKSKQMNEAQANAYRARYSNPYLLGVATQQADYDFGQLELTNAINSRQIGAELSGRSMTSEELIQQKYDILRKKRDTEIERVRKEHRGWTTEQATNYVLSQHPDWQDAFLEGTAWQQVEQSQNEAKLHAENMVAAQWQQNAARFRQAEYSAEQYQRQKGQRYITNRFMRNVMGDFDRARSLEQGVASYRDQIAASERNISELETKQKRADISNEQRANLQGSINAERAKIAGYNDEIARAQEEMKQLKSPGAIAQSAFAGVGQAAASMLQRLGRQAFQKALAEAKKFVIEFNKQMTTIQMITLKTDDEMGKLGTSLIAKAKDLKISVSEVTSTASTLYRQGLSDEEVEERLDVISKFSKVSGAKVEDATKLITVAMNTGLVSDPQIAADIVTALGDNAATNAQQIEKGIEKAGAAAAADGTTFAELASMLTAITSTTQIGGNVAGRTLNTIFGRMNKIGTNELIYDENGNAVSGSNVAKLLKAQGISMYDENGNKKSTYETLYALSQKWESMSDAEQQQMANAIAGTRQYSNFSAIMQGMSEGKVDEYMKLAESAEGTTEKKYDVYEKSLEASLTNMKNTFDELIQSLTSNGTLNGVIDFITKIINGINNLSETFGGLGAAILAIIPTVASFTVMMAGLQSGNWKLALIGAAAAGTTLLLTSIMGNYNKTNYTERYNSEVEEATKANEKTTETKASIQSYRNKSSLTDEEKSKYASTLYEAANQAGMDKTSKTFTRLQTAIENVGEAAKLSAEELNKYADEITDQLEGKDQDTKYNLLRSYVGDFGQSVKESISTLTEEYYTSKNTVNNPYLARLWHEFEGGDNILKNFYNMDKPLSSEFSTATDFSSKLKMIAQDRLTGVDWADSAANWLLDFASSLGADKVVKNLSGVDMLSKENLANYYTDLEDSLASLFRTANFSSTDQRVIEVNGKTMTVGKMSTDEWKEYLTAVSNGSVQMDETSYGNFVDYIKAKEALDESYDDTLKTNVTSSVKSRLEKFDFGLEDDEFNELINIYYTKFLQEMENAGEYSSEAAEVAIQAAEDFLFGDAETLADARKRLQSVLKESGFVSKKSKFEIAGLDYAGEDGYYIVNGRIVEPEEMDKIVNSADKAKENLIKASKNKQLENTSLVGYDTHTQYFYNGEYLGENEEGLNAYQEVKRSRDYGYIKPANNNNGFNQVGIFESRSDAETAIKDAQEEFDENVWWYINQDLFDKYLTENEIANRNTASYWNPLYPFEMLFSGSAEESATEKFNALPPEEQEKIKTHFKDLLEGKVELPTSKESADFEALIEKQTGEKSVLSTLRGIVPSGGLNGFFEYVLGKTGEQPSYWKTNNPDKYDELTQEYLDLKSAEYTSLTGETRPDSSMKRVELIYSIPDLKSTYTDAEGHAHEDLFAEGLTASNKTEVLKTLEAQQEAYDSLYSDYLNSLGIYADKGSYQRLYRSLMEKVRNGEVTIQEKDFLEKYGLSGRPSVNDIGIDWAYYTEEIKQRQTPRAANEEEIQKYYDKLTTIFDNLDTDEVTALLLSIPEALSEKIVNGVDKFTEEELNVIEETAKQIDKLQVKSVKNYFQQGAASAVSAWETSNQTALTADALYREITSNKGITDIESLVKYANLNSDARWKILSQGNTDIARLINQVYVHGSTVKAPDGTYEKLLDLLSSVGLDYGKRVASNKEKAQKIETALTGLSTGWVTNEEGKRVRYYVSQQEAEANIKELLNLKGGVANTGTNDNVFSSEMYAYEEGDHETVGLLNSPEAREQFRARNLRAKTITIGEENKTVAEKLAEAAIQDENVVTYMTDLFGEGLTSKIRNHQIVKGSADEQYINDLTANLEYGISGLTEAQKLAGVQNIMSLIKSGNYSEYAASTDDTTKNAYISSVSGLSQYLAVIEQLEELKKQGFGEDSEEYEKVITDIYGSAEAFHEAEESLSRSITTSAITSLKKYGDASEEVASYIENLSKSAKTAATAIGSLAASMNKLAYYNGQLQKMKGKKGSQLSSEQLDIVSELTGEDKQLLKTYGEDMMDIILDNAQASVDERWGTEIAGSLVEQVNAAIAKGDHEVEIVDAIKVSTDMQTGEVDVAALAERLKGIDDDLYAQLIRYANSGATLKAEYKEVRDKNGASLGYQWVLEGSTAGTIGKKTSGGGGGGKTAADKLIEKQKHEMGELTHRNSMLDIQKKHQDLINDSTGYNQTINEQISLQDEIRAKYSSQISDLKDLLSKAKEYSDEWWKIKEAIASAEESLEETKNTQESLVAEQIENIQEDIDEKKKPITHEANIIQTMMQRYQMNGDFANYEAMALEQINNYNDQIENSSEQIAEWEKELATIEYDTENWRTVRDKIWAAKEDVAAAQNNAISAQIELDRARLTQIQTEAEREQSPYEHANNMLATYGTMYQRVKDHEGYQQTLRDQNANNAVKLSSIRSAADAIREQMKTLEKGTPVWYEARNALYQYEEAEAQLLATTQENNMAIGASKVQKLTEDYQDATKHIQHNLNLLAATGEELKKEGNLEAYESNLQDQIEESSSLLDAQIASIEEMKAALDDPEITDQAYEDLISQLEQATEDAQKTEYAIKDLNREITQAKIDTIAEKYDYGFDDQRGSKLIQHQISLYQYEESKYKNRGELTNYGIMLQGETNLQKEYKGNIEGRIEELKAHRAAVINDEEAVKLIDAELYKYEEELSKVNNKIEENTEATKKNEVAILKTREAVENAIDQEIRKRIQEQKDMLSATVSIENEIMSVIKSNYEKQWELEKKTIQKKKEALQEEKNILNERLQAKKDAINTEEKMEEIARLKEQLALIQADGSRTKEVKELTKRISDLEKDLAWEVADAQLAATSAMIDQQTEAFDMYISNHEEELSEYLKNTSNFRDELDKVLNGSVDDFLDFMHKHNDEYKYATTEMQAQMDEGWRELYRNAKGEFLEYWDEVMPYIENNDRKGFLEYFKNSTTYEQKSTTGREIYIREMEDLYDAMVKAYKNDAKFVDDHEGYGEATLEDLKDWTFNVAFTKQTTLDLAKEMAGILHDNIDMTRNDVIPYQKDNDYSGVSKQKELPAPGDGTTAAATSGTGKASNSNKNDGSKSTTPHETGHNIDKPTLAESVLNADIKSLSNSLSSMSSLLFGAEEGSIDYYKLREKIANTEHIIAQIEEKHKGISGSSPLTKNANGGLIDYTGLAWVDGTMTRPESFLDATDTKLLRNMLDALNYVNTPYMSAIDSSMFSGAGNTIGDVNVTINEAEINNEQDINELAKQVGKAFTKELTKAGFQNAAYAW